MLRQLIIDTNLLLLLVIGAVEGGRHISMSKRLSSYNISDYNKVLAIMASYDELYITPYIATEVSNLIDLTGHSKELAYEIAKEFFARCTELETNINNDCADEYFTLYGITDSSLVQFVPKYTVLTADTRLYDALYEAGGNNALPYIAC